MTLPEFIKAIELYYCQSYPDGQLKLIKLYLEDRTDRALTILFAETLKTFSSQYKTLPDIAIFEGLRGTVIEKLKEDRQGQDLNRLALAEDTEGLATPEQLEPLFEIMGKLNVLKRTE